MYIKFEKLVFGPTAKLVFFMEHNPESGNYEDLPPSAVLLFLGHVGPD